MVKSNMRLSFSSKVSLVVVLVIVLSIVIHAAVEITVEANRKIEETINEKKLLTEVMASNFEFAGSPEGPPQGAFGGLRQLEGTVYLRVVNRTGEIISSSIEEENGTFISDPAISTNETVVIHDVYDEESIVVIVSPTPDNYTLWLSYSLKNVYAAINEMMTNTIMVALVVVTIFTPISYFIVSRLLRPLKKLTRLCGDISKGNFDVRSNVQSKDEIGMLSRTFDDMAVKLEKMREEIRRSERLSAIGQLATMVGHDLRNPLQSIENAAYVLNNEMSHLSASVPNSQKAMEMLRVINDSVDYADKIVRDLRDFSAMEKPILKKTDVNAIVKDTLSQIEVPKNVELITELGYLPEIQVDKDHIKRVFMNLAVNGIQAMENGGTLTVSTRKAGGFVEISFKDTGVGIPKDNMEKMFSPFFTTKAKGMGMGLAICKKFVESQGGTIHVESEVGKGTTFTAKLPIRQKMEVENVARE